MYALTDGNRVPFGNFVDLDYRYSKSSLNCATISFIDRKRETGTIPLYILPTPAPKSVDEIELCRYIEWLQQERRLAYQADEERAAQKLEFEIFHLMLFLQERQAA